MKDLLMKDYLKKSNKTTTDNGAKAFKSTLDACVDLFAVGGSSRKMDEDELMKLMSIALSEDTETALKVIFYLSDIREGQGERRFLKIALNVLKQEYPNILMKFIEEIPELTRWDYLYTFLEQDLKVKYSIVPSEVRVGRAMYENTAKMKKIKDGYTFNMSKFSKQALEVIKAEWSKEIGEDKTSLMYKWLKSLNTSSILSRTLGSITRNYLKVTPKQYNKRLKKARKYLDVVERKMSKNKWEKINYSHVPSKANVRYAQAFDRHDHVRYQEYLDSVNNGETKMNTSVLYPHDVIHQYMLNANANRGSFLKHSTYGNTCTTTYNETALETVWKNLPNFLEGSTESILPIIDTSYSMWNRISNDSDLRAIEIAVGLGIYFSERLEGEYKNHWINFSSRPTFQKIHGNTLTAKIANLDYSNWDMSTDFNAVFDLILGVAVKNKLDQSQLPTKILVVSDMQFNGHTKMSNFKEIKKKFKEHGYKLPQIVFWQVNATDSRVPVKFDTNGTALVSGYNPIICKTIINGDIKTPLAMMYKAISNEKYSKIIEKIM